MREIMMKEFNNLTGNERQFIKAEYLKLSNEE
jgi:hypothetical protein